jgi:ribosomal protein L27
METRGKKKQSALQNLASDDESERRVIEKRARFEGQVVPIEEVSVRRRGCKVLRGPGWKLERS